MKYQKLDTKMGCHAIIRFIVDEDGIQKQAARFYSRKLYLFFEKEFLHGMGGMSIEHASSDSSNFSLGAQRIRISRPLGLFILIQKKVAFNALLDIMNIPEKNLLMQCSIRAMKDIYASRMFIGTEKTYEAGS
ncbi:hypothetical protein IEQ34_011375 [Dendrobium chrysotoxum]|uniref:Uncharacterized protein n=1 Tax=Dendrobium chrysotoxum TaxID=161865 RepID=A0AAV7GYR7_DENCH|nr:hypothetical protein IEQ34_011375 [Dendrobium chrysotoxum]